MPKDIEREGSPGHDGLSPAAMIFYPRRRADVKTRLVKGEMVVLDRHEESVHQLNRTASYIWQRINGDHTPSEIAGQVCQAFEVDYPTALKDVIEVIERLERLKLLNDI
ncbi:MAG: PqqD family protein [Candidatus Binatia bacterium]